MRKNRIGSGQDGQGWGTGGRIGFTEFTNYTSLNFVQGDNIARKPGQIRLRFCGALLGYRFSQASNAALGRFAIRKSCPHTASCSSSSPIQNPAQIPLLFQNWCECGHILPVVGWYCDSSQKVGKLDGAVNIFILAGINGSPLGGVVSRG